MNDRNNGRPAVTDALRPQRTPPPAPTLRGLFNRFRANVRGYSRSLSERDRQFDADTLLDGVAVLQRLKSLGAIDQDTERIMLGLCEACLDG